MNRLSADRIRDAIGGRAGTHLDALDLFDEIDSTNTWLLDAEPPGVGRYRVALAEYQSAGRGRLQRRWLSPPGSGVCLSLAFTFTRSQERLPSLSLAIGCSVVEALQEFGVGNAALKWPNDVLVGDAKICGILCEVAPPNREGLTVVIGVGMNVDLRHGGGDSPLDVSDGAVTDLASCCAELPSRSVLAARLVTGMYATLEEFAEEGFAPFLGTWHRFDWLRRREIRVDTAKGIVTGVADGVDADGALILVNDFGTQRVTSGSVVLPPRTAR